MKTTRTIGFTSSFDVLELLGRFEARRAAVGVVGLGSMGIGRATEFAEKGFDVRGIDADEGRVEILRLGELEIAGTAAARAAACVEAGKLRFSSQFADLADCDAIVVCSSALVRRTRELDTHALITGMDRIVPVTRAAQCLVLESRSPPGTTRGVVLPRIEERGFAVGKDPFLAFSPERIRHTSSRLDPRTRRASWAA